MLNWPHFAWVSLIFLALMPSCLPTSAEEEALPAADQRAAVTQQLTPSAIPVKVAPVTVEDVEELLDLTGTAQPWDEFEVSSEISGRVKRLLAEEGEWVQKGQVLVELDKQKRLIELESRKALVARAKVELEYARRRLKRGQALLEKGAISDAEVDSLEQAVEVAEANLRVNEVAVDSIIEEIEDTQIAAPATGQISKRNVSLGETVSPAAALMTIIQINPLKVVTEIAEPYLHRVRPGDQAELIFEAIGPTVYRGRVHYLQPFANPQSGAFPTEIRLPNPRKRLQPGMVARVRLRVGVFKESLTLPLDAIVESQGNYTVFVVEDGVARKLPVEIILRIGSKAIVEGPLQEGSQVVTVGNVNLTDGTAVEVVD